MSSGATSFSVETISSAATLAHASVHNERQEGDRTGDNIDVRRSCLNQTIQGEEHVELWKDIAGKIRGKEYSREEFYNKAGKCRINKSNLRYDDGKKLSSNAVLAFECKTHYPGEMKWAKMVDGKVEYLSENEIPNPKEPDRHFQWPTDIEKMNAWAEATNKFILERFGKDNVEQVVLHLDESTPHIHAIVTPMVKNEHEHVRFSMVQTIGRKKEFAQLQTDYAKAVEHLGFHRGKEYSQERNIGLNTARQLLTKDLQEKLPDDKTEANELYQAALVKNSHLELELRNKTVSTNIQSKLRKEKAELKEQIRKLTEQKENLKKIAQIHEIEKQGLRELKAEDPEIYQNYIKSKKYIIESGMESFDHMNIINQNDPDMASNLDSYLDLNQNEIDNLFDDSI